MRGAVVLALVGCGNTVTITFAGDGAGWVETGQKRCTSSCTIENAPSVVHLIAGTPSTFGGWSSSCDSAKQPAVGARYCEVVVDRDIDLTVTFNRDPGETASLLLPSPATALAFAGDDLVIESASDGHVRRVALDGTVRWDVSGFPFSDVIRYGVPPPNLAVNATGDLYTLEGIQVDHANYAPTVIARHGDGSLEWKTGKVASAVAVTPDGGVVAVVAPGVNRLAADGSVVWSGDVPNAVSVAVDSTGMTAVATADGTIARFDAVGTRLTPDWTLPVAAIASIAFDAQDFLVVQILDPQRPDSQGGGSCAPGGRTLARVDRAGALVFRVDEDCIFGLPAGLLPNGTDLFSFQSGAAATGPGGVVLRTYGLDGAPGAWSLSKHVDTTYRAPSYTDVLSATTATCDGHGRCALAGTYALGGGSYWPVDTVPWVDVVSVP